MEGSHHVNGNSITYWKGAIHRNEVERQFLAAKGFNTDLVHFLLLYQVIISNVHVCSFTGTISDVHGCAPKMVLRDKIFCMKNYNL